MSWWNVLKRAVTKAPSEVAVLPFTQPVPGQALWLSVAESPFGAPVLDLSPVTCAPRAASRDLAAQRRVSSWKTSTKEAFAGRITVVRSHRCWLRYPIPDDFPDGVLYAPTEMTDKWAAAWLDGQVRMARSWTGTVMIVAHARREGRVLVIDQIDEADGSPLGRFGGPINTFDWMMRSHLLGQRLPLPVDDTGAQRLAQSPQDALSPYGKKAELAAMIWDPPPLRQALSVRPFLSES